LELARLLAGARGRGKAPVAAAGRGAPGQGIVDPETHHTVLPVIIARVERRRVPSLQAAEAVAGDPYLTRSACPGADLRVVS
jgi:hypothetical protein